MFRYIRYFFQSRHRRGHGIHSPFVYEMINNILRKGIPSEAEDIVTDIRREMSESEKTIMVNDHGAGPAYTCSSLRRVPDIARHSSIKRRYGRILFNFASRYNGENILELGTSVGISTMYISLGAPCSKIISIEGCENLAGIAKENFSLSGINNVDIITGLFDECLEGILKEFIPSMVFIDGNHRKEPTMRYFNTIKELIGPDSVIILDDINHSHEMREAWNEIKRDSQVSVSIDIFQMGFVFFRKGIVKQDFLIKY